MCSYASGAWFVAMLFYPNFQSHSRLLITLDKLSHMYFIFKSKKIPKKVRQENNSSLGTARVLVSAKVHCCPWRTFRDSKMPQGWSLNTKGWMQLLIHWASMAGRYRSNISPLSLFPKSLGIGRGFLHWHHNQDVFRTG